MPERNNRRPGSPAGCTQCEVEGGMGGYSSVHTPTERTIRWVLVGVILLALAYLNRGWISSLFRGTGVDPHAQLRETAPAIDFGREEETAIRVFEEVSPSVAYVTTTARGYRQTLLGGYQAIEIPQGTGSGFVWDKAGHIVTNYHVIESMEKGSGCTVRLRQADKEYPADLVGRDPTHDIAVLFISAPPTVLEPIAIASSAHLLVGQRAFAIGNPYGYDYTFTAGIVSAIGREIQRPGGLPIQNLIQTDAAISPGSSGGPLLDSGGRLIGMTTAIAAERHASNIGFAIPSDTINEVVTHLIRTGKKVRPGLGVSLFTDQQMEEIFGKDADRTGVMIKEVLPGSAADLAGLQGIRFVRDRYTEGDVIVAIDGKPVHRMMDVYKIIGDHSVGDVVTLSVVRNGETRAVDVTLQAVQ